MAINESVQMLLAARAGAYRIFQNFLGNEPDIDTIDWLTGKMTQEVLSLFSNESESYERALYALTTTATEGLSDAEVFQDRLSAGFTCLFVGPGKVEADPWESVYLSNDHVLFQADTLEVRKAYVAQGFIPRSYPHVADDHIALELDFMAELASNLLKAFEEGDNEIAMGYLIASKEFLNEHLLAFTPRFVDALNKAKHGFFYKEIGVLLSEFLRIDAEALEEIKPYLES